MRICIVGGGTAGWIAAYFISKSQPGIHEISLIESSSVGIIGAGEGSTGSMVSLLNGDFFDYKVDINKFINEADATAKLGIKHVNWAKEKGEYFAPLDATDTGWTSNDLIFKYVFSHGGKDKMHLASSLGVEYDNKNLDVYPAFHFDGHKVGKFFKSICVEDGLKVIDSFIDKINLSENGDIKDLILDDGSIQEADFFIDCTGFSRVLMNAVGSDWIEAEGLSMDTAMPFILEYSKDEVFVPQTTATALSSGWMWDIPLSTRRGCGYVFNSNFISEKEAQEEVEEFLNKPITPIKFIKFKSGYSDHFWKNNVLSLGLASSFVEPLEATSIHNTIVQIDIFVNECLLKNISEVNLDSKKDMYNKRITFLNKLTIDFISLHYQGGREDSPFWKHIKDKGIVTSGAQDLINQSKEKISGYTSFEGMYGSFSIPLANWIMAGIGIISPEQVYKNLINSGTLEYAKDKYKKFCSSF